MTEKKSQNYDLAFTHLQNNQNISAHNLFLELAQKQKKIDTIKTALLYILASECKSRQKKESSSETLEAAKMFLNFAKKGNDYNAKTAYLCASKCFLKGGNFNEAKKAYEKSKELKITIPEMSRSVVIVEDSKSIVLKLQGYLKQLGYNDTVSFGTGKEAINGYTKLIQDSKNPIVLLDMGLPDMGGDVVASKILEKKLDSQIILITADEKTTKRVNRTISSGVTAFIQKPFTINDLKDALDTVESEFTAL